MTDDRGRSVFMAGWGRPGRSDWKAVLVLAFDAEEARVLVADAFPDRFPPDHVLPASEATARSVLTGEPDPTISQLHVLR